MIRAIDCKCLVLSVFFLLVFKCQCTKAFTRYIILLFSAVLLQLLVRATLMRHFRRRRLIFRVRFGKGHFNCCMRYNTYIVLHVIRYFYVSICLINRFSFNFVLLCVCVLPRSFSEQNDIFLKCIGVWLNSFTKSSSSSRECVFLCVCLPIKQPVF